MHHGGGQLRTRADLDVTHLCFHGIGTPSEEREQGEAGYWTTPDLFRRALDLVVEHPSARLSFDDGNASDVDVALGELVERGLRADFFPIAARLGEPGNLGPPELKALVDAGMGVGSHGMHHRPWRGLDASTRRIEFDDARTIIAEAAGTAIDAAACPLGAYDRRTLAALRDSGYKEVLTSDRTRSRPGMWLQARFSIRATDTIDDVTALLETTESTPQRLRSQARILAKRLR